MTEQERFRFLSADLERNAQSAEAHGHVWRAGQMRELARWLHKTANKMGDNGGDTVESQNVVRQEERPASKGGRST